MPAPGGLAHPVNGPTPPKTPAARLGTAPPAGCLTGTSRGASSPVSPGGCAAT